MTVSSDYPLDLSVPSAQLVAVVPSDSTDLSIAPRSLYVGVSGDVSVIGLNDTVAVVFKNVPAGCVLPVIARRVKVTGTTASGIVGLL